MYERCMKVNRVMYNLETKENQADFINKSPFIDLCPFLWPPFVTHPKTISSNSMLAPTVIAFRRRDSFTNCEYSH